MLFIRGKILLIFVIVFTSCSDYYEVPAEKDETWSFVVFSDIQQGYGVFSQLAKNILNLNPTPLAAFCCGDIMRRSGNEAEWLSFNNYTLPVKQKMPLFLVRGNHENNDPASETMLRLYSSNSEEKFYYTYFIKNTFFIILDVYEKGNERIISGDQLSWLINNLDSASAESSIEHIFLFIHHPPYPQGNHKGKNLNEADALHQLLLNHSKIRAVFSGHDHFFNKYVKDGMIYITTGGGGGNLFRGKGGDYHHFLKVSFFKDEVRINVKTIDIFNEIIETFDL